MHKRETKRKKRDAIFLLLQEKEDGTTIEDVCLSAYAERSTPFYPVLPLAPCLPAYVGQRMPEEAD